MSKADELRAAVDAIDRISNHQRIRPRDRTALTAVRADVQTLLVKAMRQRDPSDSSGPSVSHTKKPPHPHGGPPGQGGGGSGNGPDLVVASIVVTPSSLALDVGQTQQLTAVAKNAAGETIAATIGWVSTNAPVASVSMVGLVGAVSAGSASIRAVSGVIESNSVPTTVSDPAPESPFTPDETMQGIIDGDLDGAHFVFYYGVKPANKTLPIDAGQYALGTANGLVPCGREADLLSDTQIALHVSGFTGNNDGVPNFVRICRSSGETIADVDCAVSFLAGAIQIPASIAFDKSYSFQLQAATVEGGIQFTGLVTEGAIRTTPELPRVVPNFDYLYADDEAYFAGAPAITLGINELLRDAVTRGAPLMDPLVPKLVVHVPAGMEIYSQQNAWLPARSAGWVYFRPAAAVTLPATSNGDTLGERIYSAQAIALNLPWLVVPDYDSAVAFQANARGYAFRGFRVKTATTTPIVQPFIDLGGNLAPAPSVECMPSRISLRQLCIDRPTDHRRFGIRLNGSNVELVDSVVFHIDFSGVDYSQQEQSVSAYQGLGQIRVKNIAAWGATEPFAFGGAGHHAPFNNAQMQPTDITFEDCHFIRPFSTKNVEGCANMGELKVGRRVHFRRCIFDGAWVDLQNGYAIVLWSADAFFQWTQTSDVTIEDCWYKDCNSGFSLSNAYDNGTPGIKPRPPRRAKFRNILFTGFNAPETYSSPGGLSFGRAIQIGSDWDYSTFDNITAINASVALAMDNTTGKNYKGLKIRNSALQGYYFAINDGIGIGATAWTQAAGEDSEFTGNVCSDSAGTNNIPSPGSNTNIGADAAGFGFVDLSKVLNVGTRATDLHKCQIAGPYAGKGADAVTLKTLLLPVEIPDAYLPT